MDGGSAIPYEEFEPIIYEVCTSVRCIRGVY